MLHAIASISGNISVVFVILVVSNLYNHLTVSLAHDRQQQSIVFCRHALKARKGFPSIGGQADADSLVACW